MIGGNDSNYRIRCVAKHEDTKESGISGEQLFVTTKLRLCGFILDSLASRRLCNSLEKEKLQEEGLMKGIIVLSKSVYENRIKENIDLFSFNLTDEDVKHIDSLNQHLISLLLIYRL